MNNQYILTIKYECIPEVVYLHSDREFLESLANDALSSSANLEYARLYKVHYPLTTLVKSWKKED